MAATIRATGTVGRTSYNGYTASRPAVFGLAKILCLGISQLSFAGAAPLTSFLYTHEEEPDPEDASLWLYLTIAMVLVLLGGAFAGLTIALMGQDGIYLQVIATSGEGREQKHAQSVYRLLKRGKHWVLVTLLLSNVIVNETLPIVLDRSLGGGWPAVLGSTVLIVIFGEVIPQSVCVRYGLQIGSFMANPVLCLMYILAPIAWPTAKLLDWLLGEDHGTVYKKSGLKTLVTLHKTLGTSPSDRLNQDEVTIISAVLDLKDKPVGDIMTPMEDVFTMSADTILDEKTMDIILSAGYSRIPIYEPGNENNFVGMLLVKILITYDPEDGKKVSEFALATLPETRPETSCLDIVNFFQEGKSHMVLVSEFPGENYGATGVVTLEDVIEELIGEEIIDESDVFIDVHKAIRRMAPAPKAQRAPKGAIVHDPDGPDITEEALLETQEDLIGHHEETQQDILNHVASRTSTPAVFGTSPKTTFMRRSSSTGDGRATTAVPVRGTTQDMREHLKHLGPSNLASRPKSTRYNAVKIKPGHSSTASDLNGQPSSITEQPYRDEPSTIEEMYTDEPAPQGGEGAGLLRSAGRDASDGVQALHQGYGSINRTPTRSVAPEVSNKASQANLDGKSAHSSRKTSPVRPSVRRGPSSASQHSSDTLGSLRSRSCSPPRKKGVTRSGSITENIVDTGGVRKVVLETNSSSDDVDLRTKNASGNDGRSSQSLISTQENDKPSSSMQNENGHGEEVKKKRKRRNKKKGAAKGEEAVVASSSGQQ